MFYKSKGVGKAAVMKKIISIVIALIIAVILFCLAGSETKGATQNISLGGTIHNISLSEDRFSDEAQTALVMLGFVCIIVAAIDVVLLALYRISWTEIDAYSIRACYMGRIERYMISDIRQIFAFGEHLFIDGSAGKIGLIVENPKAAKRIIESLMLR